MTGSVIDKRYDAAMHDPLVREFYGGKDYYNFGYWTESTHHAGQAAENLIRKLIDDLPAMEEASVLDVACGLGETTRFLSERFGAERVTGINISDVQLETCRERLPQCRFLHMDAAAMEFPAASFDYVVCVEAAFHFSTRREFLREAARVLKPGGRLVLSDILVRRWAATLNPRIPSANFVDGLEAYRDVYGEAGFASVEIQDVTRESWSSYLTHVVEYRRQKRAEGKIRLGSYWGSYAIRFVADRAVTHYLLASAIR